MNETKTLLYVRMIGQAIADKTIYTIIKNYNDTLILQCGVSPKKAIEISEHALNKITGSQSVRFKKPPTPKANSKSSLGNSYKLPTEKSLEPTWIVDEESGYKYTQDIVLTGGRFPVVSLAKGKCVGSADSDGMVELTNPDRRILQSANIPF